jgi:hypothetical protein
LGDGVEIRPITKREGYDRWAPFYDEPGNMLLEIEEPVVREILDGLPVGVSLDAACGTGRYTAYLARCRRRLPDARACSGHGGHKRGLARTAGRDHLALPAGC